MSDTALAAIGIIFNEVCVLVTTAFALTLLPGLRQPERSLLSRHDQGSALVVFLILGLVEEVTVSQAGWFNERIVAVCAAGLVAGPWVGLGVGVFVTWLAVAHHGLPLGSIATSMLCGGLVGGLLYRWRPKLAQYPITGFCLTLAVTMRIPLPKRFQVGLESPETVSPDLHEWASLRSIRHQTHPIQR
jgi:two-component system LytT family sensor kinase